MTNSNVDVVVPAWRPNMERIDQIVASVSSDPLSPNVVVVHDGPDPEVASQLDDFCRHHPKARWETAPRSGADVWTRKGVLNFDCAPTLVFIDDDVVPTRELVSAHVAALESHGGMSVGQLRTVIRPKRDPLRPSAMRYDKWYQDTRAQLIADPSYVYRAFWAGNSASSRDTFARICEFMPSFEKAYGLDGFYGIISEQLGIKVVYHDDIIGDHYVERPVSKTPAIGYSYGRSAAIMARGVEALLPDKAAEFRSQALRIQHNPVLRRIAEQYEKHPDKTRTRFINTAERLNARGQDALTGKVLDIAHLLELSRGYAEADHPNEDSASIAELLAAAHAAGATAL